MLEQEDEEVCSEKLSSGHDMVATHINSHSCGHMHTHKPVSLLAWMDEAPLLSGGITGSC